MKTAIAAICPGGRQKKLLAVVWPTWKAFSNRTGIPIVVVEKPLCPEHVFWGKYLLFDMPEFAGVDAILHLDNDILINPESPSPFDCWNPELIGVVDERSQQNLTEDQVRAYYEVYGIKFSEIPPQAMILNMGMFLFSRQHSDYLRNLYEDWKQFVRALTPTKGATYLKTIADQPHVSLALQRDHMVDSLDLRFNTLWWHLYGRQMGKNPRVFLLRAKIGSIVRSWIPERLWVGLFHNERESLTRALAEVYFLHMAGSKSPLLLFGSG